MYIYIVQFSIEYNRKFYRTPLEAIHSIRGKINHDRGDSCQTIEAIIAP